MANRTPKKGSNPGKDVTPGIQRIIAHQLKKKPEQVTLASRLREDLGADSLDALEIIMSIEDEFEISIPEAEARKVVLVSDITTFVAKNVKPE